MPKYHVLYRMEHSTFQVSFRSYNAIESWCNDIHPLWIVVVDMTGHIIAKWNNRLNKLIQVDDFI